MNQIGGFPFGVWLDSCGSQVDRYGKYDFLAGVAPDASYTVQQWQDWEHAARDWYLGGLPYELKNRFEPRLYTRQSAPLQWPELAMFRPALVCFQEKKSSRLMVQAEDESWLETFQSWMEGPLPAEYDSLPQGLTFQAHFTEGEYLKTIKQLQDHIREGDFYEINLAQAYEASCLLESPMQLFQKLIHISPVPFAAYLRYEHRYALCASPERFLQLKEGRLLTQPIKGTTPRGQTDEEDAAYRAYLSHSEKEQAENVMIVDLSRNDLQRSSLSGSVSVPHLFEIQAFPQVYQLVSTVVGQKKPALSPQEVLGQTFPPGSMTGAPKVSSLEHIDQYEAVARGLYAGSIGYLDPDGGMDFNVVIRSLMYDAQAKRISYHVGGAITYDSDPQQEFDETQVKARAIRKLFGEQGSENT